MNTTGLNLNGDNSIHGAVCATDGRDFYAAWTDQFGTNELTQDICFARSADNNLTLLAIDLTQTPQPTGLVSITAGQTWNFTAWFRDADGATSTSNLADGLSIDFQ